MIRETFSINRQDVVPIIRLYYKQAIDVLIDTGATIPVWVDTEKDIRSVISGAFDSGKEHMLGGFGSNIKTPVKVFTIPEFKFKSVKFVNLGVCISPKKLGRISLIIPASMFSYADMHIYKADRYTRISFEFTNNTYNWKYLGEAGGYVYTLDTEENEKDSRLYNIAPFLWKENLTREEVIEKMKGLIK